MAVLRFWAHFGGLEATYDDHLRLIGKRVGDFLLVLIELFARFYGWGATREYRFKFGDFAPTGAGCPKISGRRCRPHQPFFFSENCAKCSFVRYKKIWTDFSSILSQCTRLTDRQTDRRTDRRMDGQTDGRTDRQTEFLSLDHVCISCSAVIKLLQCESKKQDTWLVSITSRNINRFSKFFHC